MKSRIFMILFLFLTVSCYESEKDRISRLVKEWDGKEILFPSNSTFVVQGKDTVVFDFSHSTYKVLMYSDTVDCISCKLQLSKWKFLIQEVESLHDKTGDVSFLFYFHPENRKELEFIIRRDSFNYPVCLDQRDEFYNLNHFPSESAIQTFLLNQDNKVIAIGNPIHNPRVKELYLRLLCGEKKELRQEVLTMVKADMTFVDFGVFPKTEEQTQTIRIKNCGEKPLIIQGGNTSCGCIKVEFDKKPIPIGCEAALKIIYEANEIGHFRKTVEIYCNIASSPLQIVVTGKANER